MKFRFIIEATNFEDCALLESVLVKNSIKYDVTVNDGTALHSTKLNGQMTPRISKRNSMDAHVYAQIRNTVKMHPNWNATKIKEHLKLPHSYNTIWRVLNGEFDTRFISVHKVS